MYAQTVQSYGMTINMSILSEILSSKVRAEVFRLLFGLNDDAIHVRRSERKTGFAIGTIQTEMKKLHKSHLVIKKETETVYTIVPIKTIRYFWESGHWSSKPSACRMY